MSVRKFQTIREVIEADGVNERCQKIVRIVTMAVIPNPFSGRFVDDLSPLFDLGGQLGEQLMDDAVTQL